MANEYLDYTGLTEYNNKIKETYTTTAVTNEKIDELLESFNIDSGLGSISDEQIDTLFSA